MKKSVLGLVIIMAIMPLVRHADAALFDVDGDGQVLPLGDGLMIMRAMAGFNGKQVSEGLAQVKGTRRQGADIKKYVDERFRLFDIDNDYQTLPLTDGILIMRYLAGFKGDSLIDGAVNPKGTRKTAQAIESYMDRLTASHRNSYFDFDITYVGTVDHDIKEAVQRAADQWALILRDSMDHDMTRFTNIGYIIDDYELKVFLKIIDGKGGALAYGGHTTRNPENEVPFRGEIEIDKGDLVEFREKPRMLHYVLMHEFAHALGFTPSTFQKMNLTRYGKFTGRNADTQYRRLLNRSGGLPLDSQLAHWDPEHIPNEIMNPRYSPINALSAMTIAAFQDMGYQVDMSKAEKYLPDAAAIMAPQGAHSHDHSHAHTHDHSHDREEEHIEVLPGTRSVSWRNVTGVHHLDGTLKKDLGASRWDAGACSLEKLRGNGSFEFTAVSDNNYMMVGVSNADIDDSFTSINYAFFLSRGGRLYIYEKGSFVKNIGLYKAGDVLKVARINGVVVYRKNNTIVYASKTRNHDRLIMDTSFYSNGASIRDAKVNFLK